MTGERRATSLERNELDATYRGYAGDYGARWSLANAGNRRILEERAAVLRALLEDTGLTERLSGTILDVGAGSGETFPGLADVGANMLRLDLLFSRLAVARSTDPDAKLICGDGSQLPLPDQCCDLVFLGTVLSSVRAAEVRSAIVKDARRVVRSGGGIVCYDFRIGNPRNANTVPIRKAELRSLLPDDAMHSRSLTLAPPIARRLGPLTSTLYPLLAALPPLRTHSIVVWTVR